MESAVVFAKGSVITLDDLPPTVWKSSDSTAIQIPLGISLEEAEKIIIRETLNIQKGNKEQDRRDPGHRTENSPPETGRKVGN